MLSAVGTGSGVHATNTTFVVIGLILALIGVAHAAFPRLVWQMRARRYRPMGGRSIDGGPTNGEPADGEPTDGYLSVRIGGAVLAAMGLVILLVAILH